MMTPLVIEPRFCGPPDSGNGGYVCGLIAGRLGGQAEITLRAPPPLATPMTVESGAGDSVRVLHGRTLVAEGTRLPVSLDVDLPQPVPVSETAGREAGRAVVRRPLVSGQRSDVNAYRISSVGQRPVTVNDRSQWEQPDGCIMMECFQVPTGTKNAGG